MTPAHGCMTNYHYSPCFRGSTLYSTKPRSQTMARIHNLGFPRIGAERELKVALEKHWKGALGYAELEALGAELRGRHWRLQSGLDLTPVNDFSFYDHVLDASFLLGNVPARARAGE